MTPGIVTKIFGLADSIDNWRQRRKRAKPAFEVHYLRSEGKDENFSYGSFKVKISNQSDRPFVINDAYLKEVNGEEVTLTSPFDKLELDAHDFTAVRFEFRYRDKEIFTGGKNTALLRYHVEDEKDGSWQSAELDYEDNSDIDTI